jgi:hypothetical protein
MLEIAPNRFLIKSKIIEMKIANKDGKYWVVFNCCKIDGVDQSVFSAPFTSEAEAQTMLKGFASQL